MVGGKRQSFDEFFIGYNTIAQAASFTKRTVKTRLGYVPTARISVIEMRTRDFPKMKLGSGWEGARLIVPPAKREGH